MEPPAETARFRFIDGEGSEVSVQDADALAEMIRAGTVRAATLLFDARSARWAAAAEHDVYVAVSPVGTGFPSGQNRPLVDTGSAPEPPLELSSSGSSEPAVDPVGEGHLEGVDQIAQDENWDDAPWR